MRSDSGPCMGCQRNRFLTLGTVRTGNPRTHMLSDFDLAASNPTNPTMYVKYLSQPNRILLSL